MSVHVDRNLQLVDTLRDHLARRDKALVGLWLCTGSPLVAEIAAGSGVDLLLIDMEHAPNTLPLVQSQLQAIAAYPVTTIVRVPSHDPAVIKQVLDTGAVNILVPMIDTPEQARAAVAAVRYPPDGIRGVGSALARSGRWGRIADYVATGDQHVSVTVQIETRQAVAHAAEIAAVDGVDAVLIGPADLAASLGLPGQQRHPDVVAAVSTVITHVQATGTPVGINAFDPDAAQQYRDAGVAFVSASADVTILARGTEQLAARWG
ncbi:HpcH/HpaI aldolase family protein [Microbacterium sp. YY-01]|uniref:HpcH/HpaI aldolase family protein n=1 Tax=Microbacterium sp. YY-01 TaxID=3421634 RepID=UPI003D163FED